MLRRHRVEFDKHYVWGRERKPSLGILSFRPNCPAIAGFLFRAVARDYSFWVYIVTNHNNSERCLHFGRHDRATQHGNMSHLVANEVEAFAGERRRFIGRPEEAQLLEVSGQAFGRNDRREFERGEFCSGAL